VNFQKASHVDFLEKIDSALEIWVCILLKSAKARRRPAMCGGANLGSNAKLVVTFCLPE
jgi:hypothetical protein